MCLCMETHACNIFQSIPAAHLEGTPLQLIPYSPQRWESSYLVPQHVAIWTFFINTQEPSQLRNCFQYLVASKTAGNCSYPALMWAGSVCCSLSCLSGREGCCTFREQLLMQLKALLSLSHTLQRATELASFHVCQDRAPWEGLQWLMEVGPVHYLFSALRGWDCKMLSTAQSTNFPTIVE